MIKFTIPTFDPEKRSGFIIPDGDPYWWLIELNSCEPEYIIEEVFPNIEKIRNGELYWDPYRSPTYGPYDYYTFGYDATLIDFYRNKSIIDYSFGKGKIEVSSEEMFQFIKEWRDYLIKWRESNTKCD